jgi:hypothetical protein
VSAKGAKVTIARKSYDHLLRTRDRALSDAKWQREQVEHAHRWANEAFTEQRRLADRLNRVIAAAASLGVSIQDINAALEVPAERTTS